MPTVNRAAPDIWHQRKERVLADVKRKTGLDFALGARRGSRVARGPAGTLHLLGAAEARAGGRWWLGLNEREFVGSDDARGVVLICETASDLVDLWFSADEIRELLPRLTARDGERKFNVVRRRDKFFLQIPGLGEKDITPKQGDTAWLTGARAGREILSSPPRDFPVWYPPFLARVRKGRLEPLDPTSLEEGAVVVVRLSTAPTVPRQAALRRIVAAAGTTDLPADFAEQHDHYAHGARRR